MPTSITNDHVDGIDDIFFTSQMSQVVGFDEFGEYLDPVSTCKIRTIIHNIIMKIVDDSDGAVTVVDFMKRLMNISSCGYVKLSTVNGQKIAMHRLPISSEGLQKLTESFHDIEHIKLRVTPTSDLVDCKAHIRFTTQPAKLNMIRHIAGIMISKESVEQKTNRLREFDTFVNSRFKMGHALVVEDVDDDDMFMDLNSASPKFVDGYMS